MPQVEDRGAACLRGHGYRFGFTKVRIH